MNIIQFVLMQMPIDKYGETKDFEKKSPWQCKQPSY